MYRVYKIDSGVCYHGISLVAADNKDEANDMIKKLKESDSNNTMDSWGYELVEEDDVIDGLYAEEKGFVYFGITYFG